MNILAYGIKSSSGAELKDTAECGSATAYLIPLSPTVDLGDKDDIVILPAAAHLSDNQEELTRATALLANQVVIAAEERGQRICLFYEYDFSATGFLGARLLERWSLETAAHPASTEVVLSDHFMAYFREFAKPGVIFQPPGDKVFTDRVHILARPNPSDREASAIVAEQGAGLIYVVPANLVAGSESRLVCSLASAIDRHSTALRRPTTAPIASSFTFGKETDLMEQRKETEDRLESLNELLSQYAPRKDILFLRDDPLAERVPDWISNYLGIRARRVEQYIEDCWLLDDEGNDAIICEVKGVDGNVRREHITKLVLHREERELPDDFPSLLIVNTFAVAETESTKGRQRISPVECRKAERSHVLIARTLDLVRILDQLERDVVDTAEIWRLLTTETGWLKVDKNQRTIVKE